MIIKYDHPIYKWNFFSSETSLSINFTSTVFSQTFDSFGRNNVIHQVKKSSPKWLVTSFLINVWFKPLLLFQF